MPRSSSVRAPRAAVDHHPATRALATDAQLHIGASWYPEMWPAEEWERDVRRMRELGFTIVRLFEFAWHRCEPADGRFDLAWAVEVMDLCHAHGIQVMVGTPSAAPPAWLTTKHPDVLRTAADGTRATHGKRRHASQHSATYRRYCRRIVERFAKAFADHPALHSWQVDNEISGSDYGPEARRAFHRWLARRYGSIAELNRAWGLEFWSQAYDRFEQIPLAQAELGGREIQERHHPSLVLAVQRFQQEGWHGFIAEQCAIIRRRSGKPITTNMAGGLGNDWFRNNRPLDRVGHSLYADVEHYHWNLHKYDRMRAEKRAADGTRAPYWLLETAPSWSAGGRIWNIHHDERGIQAKTWLSTALGGTMALYWQWREHWAGQEMLHGTHVSATGRWRPNREACARLAAQFRAHGPWLLAHPPAPAEVAVMLDTEAAWGFSIDPIDENLQYESRWRDECYLPLAERHLWRDVVGPAADWSAYRVLVVPYLVMLPEGLRERLAAWVRAGGRLVLGPLSAIRTSEFTVPRDREFQGLEELIGAESAQRFPVMWVEDRVEVAFADGQRTRTRTWCEAFAPQGAQVLASYRGGYGDGLPAVLRHRVGEGEVVTVGCPLDQPTWTRLVLDVCADAGIRPLAEGDAHVVVVPRAGADGAVAGWCVVNHKEKPARVRLPAGGTDLLSGERVGPELALAPMQAMVVGSGP